MIDIWLRLTLLTNWLLYHFWLLFSISFTIFDVFSVLNKNMENIWKISSIINSKKKSNQMLQNISFFSNCFNRNFLFQYLIFVLKELIKLEVIWVLETFVWVNFLIPLKESFILCLLFIENKSIKLMKL